MMRSVTRVGFWAGLAAGLLVVIAMYFGWFTHRIPAVALALWERQMRLIPLQVFSFLIVRLKFAAKPAAFWGMLAGLVVLLGLIGAVIARWAGWKAGRLLVGAWVVVTGLLAVRRLVPRHVISRNGWPPKAWLRIPTRCRWHWPPTACCLPRSIPG